MVNVRDNQAGGVHESGIPASLEDAREHESGQRRFQVFDGFARLVFRTGRLQDRGMGGADGLHRRAQGVAADQRNGFVEGAPPGRPIKNAVDA
jgi:hypothetical protein